MIAIPNMDKPKNCRNCNFKSNKEGECWFVHDENDCPLIDIVTCGECKWSYIDERDGALWCKVHMSHYRVIADHFCGYGERRE